MKINKFIYTAIAGVLFASCQSVETPMFSDKDAFVAFDSKTLSVAENANKEIQIPISLVASKAMDVTTSFEIDTTAYANVNAAKPGIHYNLKNTDKTVTFTSTGEMTQYIVIEPIDNTEYGGDVKFDIKLTSAVGCNKGANYTITVTITDNDHPLAAVGILGTYSVSASAAISGSADSFTWTCEVQKDPDYVNRVWFTQLVYDILGFSHEMIMGEVSDDLSTITILTAQNLGTTSGYDFTLEISDLQGNDIASAVASVVPGVSIEINSAALFLKAGDAGYSGGVYAIKMTKVQE